MNYYDVIRQISQFASKFEWRHRWRHKSTEKIWDNIFLETLNSVQGYQNTRSQASQSNLM